LEKTIYQKFLQKQHKVHDLINFRDLIYNSAKRFGKRNAFIIKNDQDDKVYISYNKLKDDYQSLCTSMINRGFTDKKIAVVGANSYEWAISYLCAATVGVVVPIDKELDGNDINNFIKDAHCSAVIADPKNLAKLQLFLDESVMTICMDNGERNLYGFINEGRQSYKEGQHDIDNITIDENVMKILIFTSGTTGSSKGVCLSQKNICANILSVSKMVKVDQYEHVLSILPLHHTYECTLGFLLILYSGACISYCEGLRYIQKNIMEFSPSIIIAVPLLLENILKKTEKAVFDGLPKKYADKVKGLSLIEMMEKLPFFLRPIIKKKIKKSYGGRLHLLIVGAAGVDKNIVESFCMLGMRTLQGYGLTECAPLLAGNNDFFLKSDSTGLPIHGVEIKIDKPNEDGIGEIIAKGDNIMLGYYEDEEATAAVIKDGFFHTGDLGYIDNQGFLYITGRIKNVIVTQNGKNIYPEELENRLTSINVVAEVIVLGVPDNKNDVCVEAKIFPNLNAIGESLHGRIPTPEEIYNAVKSAIDSVNEKLPVYKRIKVFEIMKEEFEKTTTKKIKRYGSNIAINTK